ncbi:MAG TPA: hypothetical protein VIE65_13015 [Methylobacter sp.]
MMKNSQKFQSVKFLPYFHHKSSQKPKKSRDEQLSKSCLQALLYVKLFTIYLWITRLIPDEQLSNKFPININYLAALSTICHDEQLSRAHDEELSANLTIFGRKAAPVLHLRIFERVDPVLTCLPVYLSYSKPVKCGDKSSWRPDTKAPPLGATPRQLLRPYGLRPRYALPARHPQGLCPSRLALTPYQECAKRTKETTHPLSTTENASNRAQSDF